MNIFGRFNAVIEASDGLQNVRGLLADEKVSRVDRHEIGDLVEVGEKVHGSGQRTEEMFRNRLLAGEKAYILRKCGNAVCYAWLAGGDCEVYDLRISLRMSAGGGYFFDLGTSPEFRGEGMLGKALAYAWTENSLRMAVCCVRSDNRPSLSATQHLGFHPIFNATLTSFVFLRMHTICNLRTGAIERFFSKTSLRPNPKHLLCWIGKTGLEKTQML